MKDAPLCCDLCSLFNLVAYSGARTFANGKFEAMIQVCGVVPNCLNCTEKVESIFDYLDINGNFQKQNSVMPVGLDTDLYPILNFQYENINSQCVILPFFHIFNMIILKHFFFDFISTL